jgi:hypothetical protein
VVHTEELMRNFCVVVVSAFVVTIWLMARSVV